ncbi:MAG: hypothetical protein QOF30_420 [Acidimicrobiaceae bacterium]|nr:hypothetical protein [Acidimicrobiaceae bacterium]
MTPFVIYDAVSSVIWFGGQGGDANGTGIDLSTGKLVHWEGWGVDSLFELQTAVAALHQVTKMRNPAVAERAARPLAEFVQAELSNQFAQQAS